MQNMIEIAPENLIPGNEYIVYSKRNVYDEENPRVKLRFVHSFNIHNFNKKELQQFIKKYTCPCYFSRWGIKKADWAAELKNEVYTDKQLLFDYFSDDPYEYTMAETETILYIPLDILGGGNWIIDVKHYAFYLPDEPMILRSGRALRSGGSL